MSILSMTYVFSSFIFFLPFTEGTSHNFSLRKLNYWKFSTKFCQKRSNLFITNEKSRHRYKEQINWFKSEKLEKGLETWQKIKKYLRKTKFFRLNSTIIIIVMDDLEKSYGLFQIICFPEKISLAHIL